MKLEKKLYKKEAVFNFLKEKEQEGSLTNKQKKVLKNMESILRILEKIFKNHINTNIIVHMA